jgi:arsenical pump membrane protein
MLVEGVQRTGALAALGNALRGLAAQQPTAAPWLAGAATALGCNLLNNLPAGLIAAETVRVAAVPETVRRAVLIGIDLGPNLSITGSLATLLWLAALRKEGLNVSAGAFLKLGALVMPPALALAILGMLLTS